MITFTLKDKVKFSVKLVAKLHLRQCLELNEDEYDRQNHLPDIADGYHSWYQGLCTYDMKCKFKTQAENFGVKLPMQRDVSK